MNFKRINKLIMAKKNEPPKDGFNEILLYTPTGM